MQGAWYRICFAFFDNQLEIRIFILIPTSSFIRSELCRFDQAPNLVSLRITRITSSMKKKNSMKLNSYGIHGNINIKIRCRQTAFQIGTYDRVTIPTWVKSIWVPLKGDVTIGNLKIVTPWHKLKISVCHMWFRNSYRHVKHKE